MKNLKYKIINFRVSEEEKQKLEAKAKKTANSVSEYCRLLALGYEIDNLTQQHTITALIELWEHMQAKKIPQQIQDQLKQIILACK